jgi:TATA-binding protein-associated factor Taf7
MRRMLSLTLSMSSGMDGDDAAVLDSMEELAEGGADSDGLDAQLVESEEQVLNADGANESEEEVEPAEEEDQQDAVSEDASNEEEEEEEDE